MFGEWQRCRCVASNQCNSVDLWFLRFRFIPFGNVKDFFSSRLYNLRRIFQSVVCNFAFHTKQNDIFSPFKKKFRENKSDRKCEWDWLNKMCSKLFVIPSNTKWKEKCKEKKRKTLSVCRRAANTAEFSWFQQILLIAKHLIRKWPLYLSLCILFVSVCNLRKLIRLLFAMQAQWMRSSRQSVIRVKFYLYKMLCNVNSWKYNMEILLNSYNTYVANIETEIPIID